MDRQEFLRLAGASLIAPSIFIKPKNPSPPNIPEGTIVVDIAGRRYVWMRVTMTIPEKSMLVAMPLYQGGFNDRENHRSANTISSSNVDCQRLKELLKEKR